jgi:hypothetical protein
MELCAMQGHGRPRLVKNFGAKIYFHQNFQISGLQLLLGHGDEHLVRKLIDKLVEKTYRNTQRKFYKNNILAGSGNWSLIITTKLEDKTEKGNQIAGACQQLQSSKSTTSINLIESRKMFDAEKVGANSRRAACRTSGRATSRLVRPS